MVNAHGGVCHGIGHTPDTESELLRCGVGQALCGRWALSSILHASMVRLASARLVNHYSFRHSSRNVPLKLSTKAFGTGLAKWAREHGTLVVFEPVAIGDERQFQRAVGRPSMPPPRRR